LRDGHLSRSGGILKVMNNLQEVPSMISSTILTRQPTAAGDQIRISEHAIQRYQERVDASSSVAVAVGAMRQILTTGTARPRPRNWTTSRAEPAMRWIYAAERPDICLVVRNSTVVTVLTVELCAQSLDRDSYAPIPQRLRSWQQRLEDEADIYEPLPDDLAWVA
jgi:hypothetical protein